MYAYKLKTIIYPGKILNLPISSKYKNVLGLNYIKEYDKIDTREKLLLQKSNVPV